MTESLNAVFSGVAPVDAEWPHPEGASVVRLLSQVVERGGWSVGEFDNWRDVGWNLFPSRGPTKLELIVCATGPGEWMLQVAPASSPGYLGRLLGARPSGSAIEVFELASLVHRTLADAGPYRGFRWQWDGPPTERSDPQPVARA
jgi:hypothetical protein